MTTTYSIEDIYDYGRDDLLIFFEHFESNVPSKPNLKKFALNHPFMNISKNGLDLKILRYHTTKLVADKNILKEEDLYYFNHGHFLELYLNINDIDDIEIIRGIIDLELCTIVESLGILYYLRTNDHSLEEIYNWNILKRNAIFTLHDYESKTKNKNKNKLSLTKLVYEDDKIINKDEKYVEHDLFDKLYIKLNNKDKDMNWLREQINKDLGIKEDIEEVEEDVEDEDTENNIIEEEDDDFNPLLVDPIKINFNN